MHSGNPVVLVIGGGPVALAFATSLRVYMPRARITVYESRWHTAAGQLQWMTAQQGVNRREQVVTLQSQVFSALPDAVQAALFPDDGFTQVWPLGPESPRHLGFPRNIRVLDIEDRLLALALDMHITLVPRNIQPDSLGYQDADLVAIANGPRSSFASHFQSKFGVPDPIPYSVSNAQVSDVVLGLRITTELSEADAVVLTVAQNRFLLNVKNGDGYLYMRLTEDEAREVRGLPESGTRFVSCVQSAPCLMRYDGNDFRCTTHNNIIFIPPRDQFSLLWPRVKDGLKIFKAGLSAVTVFRLSMVRSPSYFAELTDIGVDKPVFGALIGDAANAIHFWPGRGMNQGLVSAVALARCLHNRWGQSRNLRSADFTPFASAMAALQHRHKDRAWRQMVQHKNDVVQPIHTIIRNAIVEADSENRRDLIEQFMARVNLLVERLNPRMPAEADSTRIRSVIERYASLETLNVFVESGTWETRLSGGPEVDVNTIVPLARSQEDARSPQASQASGAETAAAPTAANGNANGLITGGILSVESIRASFYHALRFVGGDTLAWNDARLELRALLVRAEKTASISDDDIVLAIEEADSVSPDRIECEEFVNAMRILLDRRSPGRRQNGSLPTAWYERFNRAAGQNGMVPKVQAARFICELGEIAQPASPDLVRHRSRVAAMFDDKTESSVDLSQYIEVAEKVMFGCK
ncbi:hypothetical protein BWQ96_08025 [Gracilariopsis chorda]|uniref:Uncharacterized protein n=1 Tax=Gracilariopsis chorda TaxID=448386 RepID=A0A2V3IJJ1_9FLOR|nr:hypothetical protein BWQ96_08025 [Gracilariopsis chorda]|eukprot:PXF42247.1 hypothetical protein BWQ96_08025 [Gracilariopsis chorda]